LGLAESIADIGLQTPPTVVERDGRHVLVTGRHRIDALKLLGNESVLVRLVEMDELDARMWAISENLHRAELTDLQRSEQIAEYAELAKQKREAELHSAQVAQNESKREDGRGHRHESGDALAARNLGVTRDKVRRAKIITALPEETKQAARDAGLDDNQSALLRAAKAQTPEAQTAVLHGIKERGRVSDEPPPDANGYGDAARMEAHPPGQQSATPRAKKKPVHSRDPIDDVTRDLITKCAGTKAEWRTLAKMASTTVVAKTAIKDALKRLGDAVKTRAGDRDDAYLIEGDRDELLARMGLVMAQPDQSAADPNAEIASLRAENADLRAKLADAKAEIERLKRALDKNVAENIVGASLQPS
jgi:ParB-like chromosome segregation protein Spo0J